MAKRKRRRDASKRRNDRKPRLHGRYVDLGVLFLLLICTLILFREFLFSDHMLFGTDAIPSGYMHRKFYADFFRGHHEIPRWDPYVLGGLPFIDGMHGDTFYVTTFLKFLLPVHRAMGYKLVLHIFLAGVFMYYFLRSIRLNRYGSAFGALAYMFGCNLVTLVYAGHDAKMFVISLVPLMFLCLEKAMERRTVSYFLALGGVVGLSILTSHVQMTYFALWGVGLYFLFRLFYIHRGEANSRTTLRLFGLFVVSMAVALALGSVQLVPAYIYTSKFSVRGIKTGFEHATSWSWHPEDLMSLVVPEFSNYFKAPHDSFYWGRNPGKWSNEYPGFIPLLFALFALVFRRDRSILFFVAIGVLAAIYAMGAHTPIFRLFYHLVPGVKKFRAAGMIAFYISFPVCVLGSMWCSFLTSGGMGSNESRRTIRLTGYLCAAGIFLALLISVKTGGLLSSWTNLFYREISRPEFAYKRQVMALNIPHFVHGVWITAGLLLVTSALMWAQIRRKISPVGFIGLIGLLVLFDTWRIDAEFIQPVPPRKYLRPDQTVLALQQLAEERGPFRVMNARAYSPNFLGVHGIEDVLGFHDNRLQWFESFCGGPGFPYLYLTPKEGQRVDNPFLNLLNVRYILYRPDSQSAVEMIENPGALDRAFVASTYEVLTDEEAILKRIQDEGFNYREVVLLEEDPQVEVAGNEIEKAGTVESIQYVGNDVVIHVKMERPGFLVLSDNYFPYWRAFEGEREHKIYKTDCTLRSVFLKAGTHEVIFTYRSIPYEVTRWISLSVGLFLLALLGARVAPRFRSRF